MIRKPARSANPIADSERARYLARLLLPLAAVATTTWVGVLVFLELVAALLA